MQTKNSVQEKKFEPNNEVNQTLANPIDKQIELLAQIIIDHLLNDIYEKDRINGITPGIYIPK